MMLVICIYHTLLVWFGERYWAMVVYRAYFLLCVEGIYPGIAQEPLSGAGDQNLVSWMQNKCPNLCSISPASLLDCCLSIDLGSFHLFSHLKSDLYKIKIFLRVLYLRFMLISIEKCFYRFYFLQCHPLPITTIISPSSSDQVLPFIRIYERLSRLAMFSVTESNCDISLEKYSLLFIIHK